MSEDDGEARLIPEAGFEDALRPLSESGLADQIAWALVDAAPDGIVLADESGKILLINRQTEELFGYDRGELLGRSVDALLPERFRQVHGAHRTRYRVEPTTRPMGSGHALFGLRADGTEFPVEISLSPLHAPTGLQVVAVVRDVTQRVEAEAEVRRVRESLDATRDGVLICDSETLRFTHVNQGAVEQVGYTRAELLGMTMLHIAPEYTEEALRRVLEPLVSGELTAVSYTTVHRHRNGTDVPVEIVVQGVEVEADRPRSFVMVVRDIRDRLAEAERVRAIERDLRVFEDRNRIARDLHDVVIQRLFAAGLAVQGVQARADDVDNAQRLARVVDELDETIREIRAAIFSLSTDTGASDGLRAEILRVITEEQVVLGFEPRVLFDGVIDAAPSDVAAQLLPTLREALSNVGRHARATSAAVTVSAGQCLVLRVEDDGIGICADPVLGQGIRNVGRRAADLGGACTVVAAPERGTVFEWSVPITT